MGSASSQRFKVPAEEEQGSGKRSRAALWPDGEEIKNNHHPQLHVPPPTSLLSNQALLQWN